MMSILSRPYRLLRSVLWGRRGASSTCIGCQHDAVAIGTAPTLESRSAGPVCFAVLGLVAGSTAVLADPAVVAQLGIPEPYTGELPSLAELNLRDARLELVLDGLVNPRAFEFLSDDELLITEIGGRLWRYRLGSAAPELVEGVPAVATRHEQTGLLDVAIQPGDPASPWVYLSYSLEDPQAPGYFLTAIGRGRLSGTQLQGFETLLEAGPYGWSPSNFGGAMAFDAEGDLYVSIGDRSEDGVAQRGDRLQGKILRLHADGRTPADNPFVDDPAIDDRIWALGVRNPQGLDFDRQTGRLYEAEHGPMGGDEVNLIRRGGNYGWPTITYGQSYTQLRIGIGTHAEGMIQPLWYYLPSIASSPLLVYRGAMFPEWDGDLLVGALKGQHVSWLDLDEDRVRASTPILRELNARVRDLKTGPDGAVWILTQTRGLFRLHRAPAEPPGAAPADPALIYSLVCAGCHDHGAYQAPNPAVAADWTRILAQPIELTYRHSFEGKGNMPARGLCDLCDDQALRQTIDWMLDRARAPAAPSGAD